MNGNGEAARDAWVLRPRAGLARAAWLTFFALTTPLFAVLYWLLAPHNGWRVVFAAHVAVALVFAAFTAAVLHTRIRFDGSVITETGVFGGRRRVPVADVARVLILDVYQPGALDTHRQLFLIGRNDAVLLRLRGQLWQQSDIDALAAAVGAPMERETQPLARREVKRLHPGLLRWFER